VVAYGDMGTAMPFNITANGGDQQWEAANTVRVNFCYLAA